jgi:SAM-dependent methyltransferase
MLTWKSDERLVVGETAFRILPDHGFWGVKPLADGEEADFFVAKPRWLVERYIELIDELNPQRIFELGMFQGGSTALFAELARPERLVAIDQTPGRKKRVEEYAASLGLGDAVRTHGGVDQADRARLAAIVAEDFEDRALDLVVDDCSHLYAETRASFNELFPRLRPDGLYVIEDWPWAHTPLGMEPLEGLFPDQVPLTRLIFELVLAIPAIPGLIADVKVDLGAISVRRGEAEVDPDGFDVAASSNPRGRALLTPDPSASSEPAPSE